MTDAPRLEYVIRRLNWRRTHDGIIRMPGFVSIGALPTLEEAEADRVRREAEVRARVNPFTCGSSHAMRSRMPELIFHDWLRDVGLEPPALTASLQRDWARWWSDLLPALTTEQIEHVWNGLDRVRFFEVAARPEGSVGYAVVRVEWEYNDQWNEPGVEGGTPVKVFRRWTAAEEYRRTLEEAERRERVPNPEDEIDDWTPRYEINRWTAESEWPFGAVPGEWPNLAFALGNQVPYYELVEIELPPLGEGRL